MVWPWLFWTAASRISWVQELKEAGGASVHMFVFCSWRNENWILNQLLRWVSFFFTRISLSLKFIICFHLHGSQSDIVLLSKISNITDSTLMTFKSALCLSLYNLLYIAEKDALVVCGYLISSTPLRSRKTHFTLSQCKTCLHKLSSTVSLFAYSLRCLRKDTWDSSHEQFMNVVNGLHRLEVNLEIVWTTLWCCSQAFKRKYN